MRLEERTAKELEDLKSDLEYRAQACALEGLPMSRADLDTYAELKRELERRVTRGRGPDTSPTP